MDIPISATWVARAMQYAAHLEKLRVAALVRGQVKMRERQAKHGVELQELAMRGLTQLAASLTAEKNAEQLSAVECTRLFEVGAKIERLARGEETEAEPVADIRGIICKQGEQASDAEPRESAQQAAVGELNRRLPRSETSLQCGASSPRRTAHPTRQDLESLPSVSREKLRCPSASDTTFTSAPNRMRIDRSQKG